MPGCEGGPADWPTRSRVSLARLARRDRAAARRFLDEALNSGQALASGKKADAILAAIRKQIASLDAPAKS